MIEGHTRYLPRIVFFFRAVVQPFSAQFRNAFGTSEQCTGRSAADQHQDPWSDQFDVPPDEGQANGHLVCRRLAVSWRTPRQDVRDVDRRPVQSDCRNHFIEKLTAHAYERPALPVLVSSRRLADKHDGSLWIAVAKHQIHGRVFERAALELLHRIFELSESSYAAGQLIRIPFGRRGAFQGKRDTGLARWGLILCAG